MAVSTRWVRSLLMVWVIALVASAQVSAPASAGADPAPEAAGEPVPPVFGDSSVAAESEADELPAAPSEGATDAGAPVDSGADFSDPPPTLGQFWDALIGRRQIGDPPVLADPGRGFDEDASTRVDERTTERVEVYANPDGTETMFASPEAVRFRDPSGAWVDYDLDLVDSGDGALVAQASDSGVRVPLDPVAGGMATVDTAAGRLTWSLPDVLDVEAGGDVVEVLPAQHLGSVSDAAGHAVPDTSTPLGDANTAALDGGGEVDGLVEVTKDGFEQSVVVPSADGPSSYRVVVELPPGVVARNVETAPGFSAHVEFVGADGGVVGMFGSGVAHDSAGAANGLGTLGAVRTSVLSQDSTGAVLQVAVDEGWFSDPGRVFPVTIDPTWTRSARDDGYDTHVQENLPSSSGWSSDVLYVGDYAANTTARAFVTFTDLPTGAPSGQFYVTDADLVMYNSYANTCDQRSIQVEGLFEDFSATTTWNDQPALDAYGVEGTAMVPLSPCALGFHSWDVTAYARRWFEGTQAYMASASGYSGEDFGLRLSATDEGDPLTWRAFRSGENTNPGAPVLAVTYETRPGAPVHSSPEDGAHLLEEPTLEVDPVTDPDGDPVKYWFRVWSTPSEFENGLVLNSGWIDDPSWTPPAESLQEGVSYTWRAYATDQETTPMWSLATRSFTVDGHPAYAPTDGAGPFGVDLATGNLTVGWSGPQLATVEGSLGVGASYDAASALPESGLTGSYFNDGNDNESFDDDVVLRRTDPSVSFIWTIAGGPYPELETGEWLARWEGFVEVPTTGEYEFGTVHYGKTRVIVDGTTVLDRWSQVAYEEAPAYDANPVSLSAGESYPITVEFAAPGPIWGIPTDGFVELWAKGAVSEQRVDGSWLSPKQYEPHEALPDGWTLGATSYAGFTHAEVGNDSVTVKSNLGYGLVFNRTEDGSGWEPAEEWNDATLADDATAAGRLTLSAEGWTYVFDTDGKLVSASSPVTEGDSAPSHTYATITVGGIDYQRLVSIGDSVSGRSIALRYADGSDGCPETPPGFDSSPPTGMLCEVAYWDGTSTELFYAGGRLARVTNPGAAVTDFTYGASGLLAGVRDPLAADAVAAGVRADDSTTFWEASYDADGRVETITGPEPDPGEARPQTSYDYATAYTDVYVAGQGFARRASYHPDFGRQVTETGPDGLTSTIEYDESDRPWATTDGAGMKTTTIFNDWGLATDTYGPAPAAWFDAEGYPLAAHAAATPHHATGYDEFNTLHATWWDNTEMSGAPVSGDIGVGTPGGEIDFTWSSHPDTEFITGNDYSGRLTGEINLAQAGDYTIEIARNAKVVAFVDGTLIGLDWEGASQTMSATVHVEEPGWKQIMIGFAHPGSGNASLELRWKPPGAGSAVVVPGTALRPQMGVATSQTGADGEVTAMGYEDPATGIATTSTLDPGGEDLTQSFAYEAAGAGYRRMLSRTLPAGEDTEVSYAYYGDTETRDNPCTADSDAANQAGAPKLSTGADPDGAGGQSAITEEWVYDAAGRVVAERSNDDDWICTTYDSRGRPVTVDYPAWGGEPARTVITNTAAGGTGGGSPGHADVVLEDDPLAYWRLGESSTSQAAADASGNGHDGTYRPTVTLGAGGAIEADTAASFSGTSDSSVATPDLGLVEGGDFSVEAWVKTTESRTWRYVFSEGNSASVWAQWGLMLNAGKPRLYLRQDNATQKVVEGPVAINDNTWHHLAATREGDVFKLYVDGAEVGSLTYALGALSVNNSRIASWQSVWPTAHLAGSVDDVAVYDHALSAADVAEHHANTTAGDPGGGEGDPLVTTVTDPAGTITTTTDLLGRVVEYEDVWGQSTSYSYDQAGRLVQTDGLAGQTTTTYDVAGRIDTVSVDGELIADASYDSIGRLVAVDYPDGAGNAGNGTSLAAVSYDELSRLTGLSWNQSSGGLLTSATASRAAQRGASPTRPSTGSTRIRAGTTSPTTAPGASSPPTHRAMCSPTASTPAGAAAPWRARGPTPTGAPRPTTGRRRRIAMTTPIG